MRVEVFADDPAEGRIISIALREFGLSATPIADFAARMSTWQEDPADIIVLAWSNRPEISLSDVHLIREQTQAPVLVINEPLPDTQECLLLEEGVDLMLDRPVSLRLLSNYVKVLSRISASVPSTILNKMELDAIVLDTSDRTITLKGQAPVRLTHLEFRLLYLLMSNQETVVPTEAIADRVWGYHDGGDRELVRGLVSRLRRKIEPDRDSPHFIENIPGVGYRFHAIPVPADDSPS